MSEEKANLQHRAVWLCLAVLGMLAVSSGAEAQGIMVSPVSVVLGAGQQAAALTVVNNGEREVSFQIRAYAWREDRAGVAQLTPTPDLIVSPPLGTIATGATQTIRLMLTRPPQDREASYRILLDELASPAQTGLHIALRLSIPIFAEPTGITSSRVRWQLASEGQRLWLVARNDGNRHDTIRDIALRTEEGRALELKADAPPYVLAGGEHRWSVEATSRLATPGTVLRLTANGNGGAVAEQVRLNADP